jgi:hypothetical protein
MVAIGRLTLRARGRALWQFTGLALAAVVVSGSLVPTAGAADPPAPATPERLVLFDGKSLAGWKPTEFARAPTIRVEDGAIVMPTGHTMTGITSTRRDLPRTNYELSYEAMRLDGVDFFAAATFPVGASYLTFVNGGWSGNVTGLSSINGSDASENETSTYYKYKNDTWYRFRVRVGARRIRCWIDDRQVVDLDTADRELGTRLETRASEPLGFATWDTSGALRKIEIRRLTPTEAEELSRPAQ